MRYLFLACFLLLFGLKTLGQQSQSDLLTKEAAVKITLENNFGVRIAQNNVAIADNNKSLLNSNFLPSFTGNGGASYDNNDQEATFQDASVRAIEGAETTRYNASLDLSYTLFDGLGRWYDYKRLKEKYGVSELEARETIETTMLQLFSIYFEVARISENIGVLEETYKSTENRLKRAEYSFEYGQSNKLDVLNAEVDLVNDSINLMNERQLLRNTHRDLNIVLNQELEIAYRVDITITFTAPMVINDYLDKRD